MKNCWKNKRSLAGWPVKRKKNRRISSRFLIFFGVLGLSLGVLSGCGGNLSGQVEEQKHIAVICKGQQHQFWKTVEQGAMDAGEEIGAKIVFEAPQNESEIDVQINMMEQAIQERVDAIVLAPLDTEKLNEVIAKATKSGIPVLTFDSDVTEKSRVATIGTSNESAGAIAARNAAELMEGSGQVAIISTIKEAQTGIERIKGFVDEMEKNYPEKIKVVDTAYCGGDPEVAKKQTIEFMKKYPNLKCIYGVNEGSAVGVAAAIKEQGKEGAFTVIGFDSSDEEIAYLEEGVIDGMVVQNPYNMGYLGVYNINRVLEGETIQEKIDTGATYVNLENLEDEDTQWLLYPLGKTEQEEME